MLITEKTLYRVLVLSGVCIVLFIVAYVTPIMEPIPLLRISIFTIVIPVGVGWLIAYRNPLPRPLKLLLVFLSITLVFDAAEYVMQFERIPNLDVMQIYSLIEYLLLCLIFISLHSVRSVQKLLGWSIPVFVLAWCLSYWYFFSEQRFNNIILTLESILLCGIALLTLIDLVRNNFVIMWLPGFWIIVAVLIYFAGDMILFSLWNFILPSHGNPDQSLSYWFYHHVLNLAMHAFYTISFLCLQMRLPIRTSA